MLMKGYAMLTSYSKNSLNEVVRVDSTIPNPPNPEHNHLWINLTNPTEQEVDDVVTRTGVSREAIEYALDPNQISMLELFGDVDQDGFAAILVDAPTAENLTRGGITYSLYQTYPLGIILYKYGTITVSLKDITVLHPFSTNMIQLDQLINRRSLFVLNILLDLAHDYNDILNDLIRIAKTTEEKLYKSLDNEELIKLLIISRSLIFLKTSISTNDTVVDKLANSDFMRKYDSDSGILEDVRIETKQALEMISIYNSVLKESVDVCANIIANNQNKVMKFLAAITLMTAVPTIVGGLFGMNVPGIPFARHPFGFWLICATSACVALVIGIIMHRKQIL